MFLQRRSALNNLTRCEDVPRYIAAARPDFTSRLLNGFKPMGIEASLPQTRIKQLDVRVIRRGNRSRKDQMELVLIRPLVQRVGPGIERRTFL